MQRKKLLLIFPRSYPVTLAESERTRHIVGRANRMYVSLPTIAALTPRDFDVQIVDENVEPIDVDNPPDIVGLTAFTPHKPRALQIADE